MIKLRSDTYPQPASFTPFLLPLHLKTEIMVTIEQIKDLAGRRDALRRYL